MSHTVTVTRTTTTTNASVLYINTGYLKTVPGLLKLAQLVLGIVVVSVMALYWQRHGYYYNQKAELFFFMMAVTFLIGTFCLLFSCLISMASASIISKTVYEVVYHAVAAVLYLIAAVIFIVEINRRKKEFGVDYEPYFVAAVLGLVVAILYIASTVLANRVYRGI